MLAITKEECAIKLQDYEEKLVKEKGKMKVKEQLVYMEYEDVLSLTMRWQLKHNELIEVCNDQLLQLKLDKEKELASK